MIRYLLFLAVAIGMSGVAAAGEPLAGWFGVFPELPGYARSFDAPVVEKGEKPAAYRQTAKYLWTGGAIKQLEVTLARDPAFRTKHTAEVLRKTEPAPAAVKVGKRAAWLWDLEQEAAGKPGAVVRRLLLPLGEDRALLLEAKEAGPWENLISLAEKFDAERIAAALAAPPRTDARRRLEDFRSLKKGCSYADVEAWVGPADRDIGSGIHVLEYKLAGGAAVLVGTADFKTIQYVKHRDKDGKVEDLAK